jgi:dihydropteroate synthase
VAVTPRRRYSLPLLNRAPLELGERTLVMGIINVTPDSFADGGVRFDPARAIADGLSMVEDGADILDVGGESTRPGAEMLPEDEELRRVLPVVERLAIESPVPISIDTYKARVAREALDRGAAIVNDISGLLYDDGLGRIVAETGAAIVLMHTRGRSRDMYKEAVYSDVIGEVSAELTQALARADAAGIARNAIVLDPGLGFSKKAEHTFETIARLDRLAPLGHPLLVGPSRKSYLKSVVGDRPAPERDWATAAAVTACVLGGAHIVRVHAVREMVDVVRAADRILEHMPN